MLSNTACQQERDCLKLIFSFIVQKSAEPRVQWISEQMQSLSVASNPSQAPKLKAGDLCLAKFSLDNQLYRQGIEPGEQPRNLVLSFCSSSHECKASK